MAQTRLDSLRQAACMGNVNAQMKLAEMFQLGMEVPVNQDSGRYWLEAAAATGHPDALFLLGNIYLRGMGIKKNIRKGVELLEQSAEKNNIQALLSLFEIYEKPEKEDPFTDQQLVALRNPAKAFEAVHAAAELGSARAAYLTALKYHTGNGVTANDTLALEWLEKAAAKNYGDAQAELADWLFHGQSPAGYDLDRAKALYQKVHDNRNAPVETQMRGLVGLHELEQFYRRMHNYLLDLVLIFEDRPLFRYKVRL